MDQQELASQILAHVAEGLTVDAAHGHAQRVGHLTRALEAIEQLVSPPHTEEQSNVSTTATAHGGRRKMAQDA